jgi:hypothetical protein
MVRLAVFALLILMPRTVQTQTSYAELLGESFELRRRDIMALEGGRIMARILKTNDAREVAVIGAVHVRVPVDALADFYRDVETLSAGDEIVVQAGMFGEAPTMLDMQPLQLPEVDFEALRQCRVARCKVKLSRDQIELLNERIDWSHPDHQRRVTTLLVSTLVADLYRYLSEGNEGLPVYHDKDRPLNAAEDVRALLFGSRRFLTHDPGLYRYLYGFPDVALPGVEDSYYWAVEDFGLRPVTTLNHMMISREPASGLPYTTVAIKQIYASHYLQSMIKLATLAPASEQYPLRGTYLVLYAHMRFDSRVGAIKRAMLERQLEHSWAMQLESLRERTEEKYRIRVARRDDG